MGNRKGAGFPRHEGTGRDLFGVVQGESIMMCSHAKELMASCWQRELTGDDAAVLRQHLGTCAECSAEMAALGGLWERLADLPVPEPSQALDTRWQLTLDTL